MKYNLYYRNSLINSVSLSESQLKYVMSQRYVHKQMGDGTTMKIPVKDIRCVRCVSV